MKNKRTKGDLLRAELGKYLGNDDDNGGELYKRVMIWDTDGMSERDNELRNELALRFFEKQHGDWTEEELKGWFRKAANKYDSSKS